MPLPEDPVNTVLVWHVLVWHVLVWHVLVWHGREYSAPGISFRRLCFLVYSFLGSNQEEAMKRKLSQIARRITARLSEPPAPAPRLRWY